MPQHEDYLLGHSQAEETRLLAQTKQFQPEAVWLLDQLGIQPGQRALDLGCGPRGILDLLSERVGPRGTVVGFERSPATAALAQAFLSTERLGNVEVVVGDARATGLARGSFDVAHMRLVLVNVPRPEEIVTELAALVKPGGVIACHEADYVSHCCQPSLPAWDRLKEVFAEVARGKGVDLFIGRRLPGMLRTAGLVDIQVKPLIYTYGHQDSARLLFLQFVENAREEILSRGLLREKELTDLLTAVRAHLDDPGILVISHLFIQAWGRKP